ncbi:Heterogeneous nuclear ribonucleoprotein U-like protein 1 [Schistosoma japonicum]|nr:Heterogeneous nuclear ribonucleoprotein U-like protein 1 [Schistosoma japonicum]KAH8867596.1 Heterogeneous nuclear ribonucleoprotein U-like protein 1 [Schistosoma japonicum]
MSEDIDVSKLKVPELRAELGRRGLNTFGTKQILMDRLNDALKSTSATNLEKPQLTDSDEHLRLTPPSISKQASQNSGQDGLDSSPSVSPQRRCENGLAKDDNVDDQHQKPDQENLKRRRSPSHSPRRRSRSRERDSRRSPRRRSRSPQFKSKMIQEPENWEESVSVFLDTYNCDLNLLIDATGCQAKPLVEGGFSLMWAGAKANYGTISKKSFFEVKVVKNLQVENYDSLVGGATHVLRIGWSTEDADFTLGEEPQSYGYGGTGKKSCNNKFVDYGCTFGEGDVVGAFIEWTSTEAVLRFSVNGVDQGECYRVQKSQLGERYALFPHVYVKNVEFACNFGQENQPAWFSPNIPSDDPLSWQQINSLPLSCRVRGRCPPQSKAECEVIMMVGLPGAGKTYFAERLKAEHREKQYNLLGTNLILDKMKVMGIARQRNYHGRWDVLIDKSTKCLNTLISMACMRRRNYILDQTNVYPSAQRRKMRPFEGFKRKAIVIVPTDEEFRRRIAQREKEEGKEVPETAVLEMKANFGLPRPISEDPSSVFDEVIFTELGLDDAKTLVAQYNQEGQANRQPPEKRQRWDGGNRDRDDSRNSRFRGRDNRDRGRDMPRGRRDDFRSSPNRRNDDRGRRDYRGGYNASRDRSRDGDRFDRNNDRDSFGRQPGGRYGGGPPGGRFGAPGRGPFPSGMSGPGGFGGFDGPRGNMMRGGPARGGFPNSGFDSRGGRGPYRGSMERGNVGGYSGQNDPMYGHFDGNAGDAEPMGNAYDINEASTLPLSQPPYEGGPVSGGFRGGYGGGGRGVQMQVPRGAPGRGPAAVGRGSVVPGRAANSDRGLDRAQLGRNASIPGRGGAQSDRDMVGGFLDDNQQYMYGSAEGYQNPAEEPYSGPPNDDYRNRRFAGSGPYNPNASQKPNSYPTYQRGNPPFPGGPPNYPNAPSGGYNRNSVPSYGNPNPGSNYPNSFTGDPGSFTNTGSDPYGGNMAADRPGRPGMQPNQGGSFGGPHGYGTSDSDKTGMSQKEHSNTDGSSLYASGASRYSDNRPPATNVPAAPRQSRFDTKPESNVPSQQNAYNSYAMGSNYAGGFASNGNQKAVSLPTSNPPGGPRGGRSRFDVGPPASQPVPSAASVQSTTYPPSQPASRPQPQAQQTATSVQQPQQPQGYGYGYSTQNAKPDAGNTTNTPVSQSYGAYNYGYGYGAYGSQPAQPSVSVSRPTPAGATQQSLYASVVADKPQQTQQAATSVVSSAASTTVASDHPASAAAAYASYYYGASQSSAGSAQGTGKYDAAMVAAQQFNAWQQQQQPSAVSGSVSSSVSSAPTATVTPQTQTPNPYASYYHGYSTYPSSYSTMPIGGAPPGGVPTAVPPAPTMSQYYTGYR